MTTTYTEIQTEFINAATNISSVPEASVQIAETFVFDLISYLSWPNGLVVYDQAIAGTHIPITGIGSMNLAHTESDTMFYTLGGGSVTGGIQLYVEVDMSRVSPIRLKCTIDAVNNTVSIEFRRSNFTEDVKKDHWELQDWTFQSREFVYEILGQWIKDAASEVLVHNWWKDTIVDNQTAQVTLQNLGLQA